MTEENRSNILDPYEKPKALLSVFVSVSLLVLLLLLLGHAGPQRSTSFLFQIKLEFYCYQCWDALQVILSFRWLLVENRWGSRAQYLCKQILCVTCTSRLSLVDRVHALEKGTIIYGDQTLQKPGVHSYQISWLVTSDITSGCSIQQWFCPVTQSVTCDLAIRSIFHPVKNTPIQALLWVPHWPLGVPNKDLWNFFPTVDECRSNYARSVLVSLLSRQRTQFNMLWMACTVPSPRGLMPTKSRVTTPQQVNSFILIWSRAQNMYGLPTTNDCIVSQTLMQ